MENFAASDLAWVSRVMGGDTVAGDELVERLRPTVARIVRGRVTLRAEEEDLTQAVFLKVFGNLQSFSGRVPLEHWVSRIAVNVCLQQFRHERRRRELRRADLSAEEDLLLDVVAASDNEVGPDQQLTAQDLVARIFEVLSPRERIVMSLLHLEGQDLEEAARLTGNSNLAVRLIAFRARRKMKKAFQKLQQGEWK